MNTIGAANILITTPTEYPDPSTGSIDSQIISGGIEKLIKLDVIKLESVPEVQRYSYYQVIKNNWHCSYPTHNC